MTEILFVCTGNTCRSPMAEGLFNLYAKRGEISARAFSRGLAVSGICASTYAQLAVEELGADISGHGPRRLAPDDLRRAQRVYCMTRSQLAAVAAEYPQYADKLHMLDDREISDPYGGSLEDYTAAARQIDSAVKKIADGLQDKNEI